MSCGRNAFLTLRSKNPNLTAPAHWASSKGRAADLKCRLQQEDFKKEIGIKGGGPRYPASAGQLFDRARRAPTRGALRAITGKVHVVWE